MSNIAKQILLSNNFWVLNKTIVNNVGIESALILSVMTEADQRLADEEGWFFQTIETIEELTTLNRYKQTQAINNLIELGILEQQNRGMPMKRYFRINTDNLVMQFVNGSQTSMLKSNKLVCQKPTSINNNTYKEHNYKELNNKDLQHNEIIEIISRGEKPYRLDTNSDYFKKLVDTYKNIDVLEELNKMALWCESNPTKRKTVKGMPRFINNWLNSNNTKAQPKNNSHIKNHVSMPDYSSEINIDEDVDDLTSEFERFIKNG